MKTGIPAMTRRSFHLKPRFRYTNKSLPGQLPLIPPELAPCQPEHDPSGLSLAGVAVWVLQQGTQRLTRHERNFLFGVSIGRLVSEKDQEKLSNLHQRIGGRALPPPISNFWR